MKQASAEARFYLAASRLLIRRIEDILRVEWDPIGVGDMPGEYDGYVAAIARLVAAGASAETLVAHLLHSERDRMGLPGNEAVAARVSEHLLALRNR
jgi:hypothetical protein